MSTIDALAREVVGLRWIIESQRTPQLAYSSLHDGSVGEYDVDGQLVSRFGKQFDGTHGTVILAGPKPPIPAAPSVMPVAGGIRLRHEGGWVTPLTESPLLAPTPATAPLDFERFEVYASTTPVWPGPFFDNLKATIESARGGEVLIALDPAAAPSAGYYFWVAARAKSGKLGDPSTSIGPYQPINIIQLTVDAQTIADAAKAAADQAVQDAQAAYTAAEAAEQTAGAVSGRVATAQQAADDAATQANVALAAAQAADTLGTNAQQAADLARSAADAAQEAADLAGTAAAQADADAAAAAADAAQAIADAAAAQARADKGVTDAASAQARADKAVTDAADAQAAAATAKSTADTAVTNAASADQKARDAAGLAGTKGTVYYGTAAPTADPNGLWIDTTSGANTPKRHNGTAWVAVTDKTATDAASAAAGAKSTADTAVTNAATAQARADKAVTDAATAQARADKGVADAATAQARADKAVTDAATAKSTADTAVTNAAAADQKARDAAGLAGTKGTVYYGTAAPAGDTLGLWIDQTGGANTPKRWNGSAWVAVTDKAATDAASAASTAKGVADTALANAATADGKAVAAQQTADAAVTASAINRNPHFSAWAGVHPDGWSAFGTVTPVKETTLDRSPPNAVRFNVPDATVDAGMTTTQATVLADLPLHLAYVAVEVDVYVVSGTLGGAGILLDWVGMTGTIRTAWSFASDVPTLQIGKWYRLTRVLSRPTAAAGTQTGWSTWLTASYASTGTKAAKNIVFDRIVYRPATAEEVTAITGSATATAALNSANGKVKYFTAAVAPAYSGAADTAIWIDTANGRRINRWDGTKWDVQQFGNLALAPGSIVASDVLVQGTVTAALLKADAIDGKTITGATLRTAPSGQRIQIDSTDGLVGYNSAGTAVTSVSPATGALTATGATITGVIRTAPSGSRVQVEQRQEMSSIGVVGLYSDTDTDLSAATFSAVTAGGTKNVDLKYGMFNGYDGPVLSMMVDPNDAHGAGANASVMSLSAAKIELGGAIEHNGVPLVTARQRQWNFLRSAHTAVGRTALGPTGATYGNLIDGTAVGAPAGDYLVTLTMMLDSTPANGNVRLHIPNILDVLGDPLITTFERTTPYTWTRGLTHTGGDLRLLASLRTDAACNMTTVGSAITLAYLGPR